MRDGMQIITYSEHPCFPVPIEKFDTISGLIRGLNVLCTYSLVINVKIPRDKEIIIPLQTSAYTYS